MNYIENSSDMQTHIRFSGRTKAQFARFLFVGGLNTLFGYGMFALLLYGGMHYAVASLLATILGILFNFMTTGTIVFQNRNHRLLFRFVGVYAVTYVINVTSLKVFDLLKINMFLAGGLLLLPAAVISYMLNRKFVFITEQP